MSTPLILHFSPQRNFVKQPLHLQDQRWVFFLNPIMRCNSFVNVWIWISEHCPWNCAITNTNTEVMLGPFKSLSLPQTVINDGGCVCHCHCVQAATGRWAWSQVLLRTPSSPLHLCGSGTLVSKASGCRQEHASKRPGCPGLRRRTTSISGCRLISKERRGSQVHKHKHNPYLEIGL